MDSSGGDAKIPVLTEDHSKSLHVPEDTKDRSDKVFRKPNYLSRLFFTWFTGFAFYSWRNEISTKDLFPLEEKLDARSIGRNFLVKWREQEERSPGSNFALGTMLFKIGATSFVHALTFEVLAELCSQVMPILISLLISILDAIHGDESSLFFHWDVSLRWYTGLAICAGMFLIQALHSVLYNRNVWITYKTGLQSKIGLMGLVYDKTLRLSARARQGYSLGKSVALMSTSINRIDSAYPYFHFLWFCPLQVAFLLFMLYWMFGTPAYWIIALLVAALPLQVLVMTKMNTQRKFVASLTDRRLRFLQETIVGIKVVKFFAWESIFSEKLKRFRDEELREVRRLMLLASWSIVLNVAVPALSGVIGFVLYSWDGRRLEEAFVFPALTYLNMLDLPLSNMPIMATLSVDAFAAAKRLQDFLRAPDTKVKPTVDFSASQAVLIEDGHFSWENELADERKPHIEPDTHPPPLSNLSNPSSNKVINVSDTLMVERSESPASSTAQITTGSSCASVDDDVLAAITAKRVIAVSPHTNYDIVDHTWCHGDAAPAFEGLQNINLSIPRGCLVAIVGPVGSGKSSLLAAMFGEMERTSGQMVVGGEISYCPQAAWLLNASVRQNILVGKPFEEEKYWQVIKECQMEEDLLALPLGDLTDIGEGGISLSGGQKARVNLARTAYNAKEIILMDDPLSAVDNRVGKAIFENCIASGILSSFTRILVTHHLGVLPRCEMIIVMKDGRVSDTGTYAELMRRSSSFASLLQHYTDSYRANAETEHGHTVIDDHIPAAPVDVTVSPSPSEMTRNEEEILQQKRKWREEELQAQKVSARIYGLYFYAAGGLTFVALFVIFMTLNEIFRTGRDIWLDWWIALQDGFGLSLTHRGFRDLYISFAFIQTFLTWICGFIFIQGGYKASLLLHDRALSRIMSAPIRFFDSTPVGRIINRFGRDMDMVDTQVADDIWYLLFAFGSMTSTIMVMFVRAAYETPAFCLPIAMAVLLQAIYRTSSRQLQKLYATKFSPLMANFSETYLGLTVLRAMGNEYIEHFRQRHYAATDVVSRCVFATLALRRWTSLYCEFISATLISMSGLGCLLLKVDPGSAGLILSSLVNFVFSLDWFIKQFADLEASMVAVERLHQYALNIDSETPDEEAKVVPAEDWPSQGHVQFQGVYLSYRTGTRPVLTDLNLDIISGERVGIVGRTGAGKSSILTALLRAVEISDGTISIDGVDLREITLGNLRSRITMVPQDAVLFAGPLRFNLDPSGLHADAAIWTALDRVGLKKTVSRLEGKLDYEVRDMGENFSLGQRQLFCLARALLRRSKVILMDEATASMDVGTDSMIQKVIREDFAGCTIITIAHRLGTIRDYDRIVVMDAGKIAEQGSPDQLLANPNSRLSLLFKSTLKMQ